MKFTHSLALAGTLSLILASCGGSMGDQTAEEIKKTRQEAAERAKVQDDQDIIDKEAGELLKKEEAEAQTKTEAARQAVVAPTRRGEFPITVTPDSEIVASYAVPVHIFSVSEAGAKSWASKSAPDYWKSPNPDAQAVFGTKSGSLRSAYVTRGPFRSGEKHVVVVVKIPGVTGIEVFELERKPDPAGGPPIVPPLNLRLTPAGIQVR